MGECFNCRNRKEKLKPLSLYGLDARDVIKAFMQVKPERIRELEEEERKQFSATTNELMDGAGD